MELYRYLIDDFVISVLSKIKQERFHGEELGFLNLDERERKEYLNDSLTRNLAKGSNEFFKTIAEILRIRMDRSQEIETLINEEALLFAMYLRSEKQTWIPRIVSI